MRGVRGGGGGGLVGFVVDSPGPKRGTYILNPKPLTLNNKP